MRQPKTIFEEIFKNTTYFCDCVRKIKVKNIFKSSIFTVKNQVSKQKDL
jgi:hypothetical protein